MEASRGSQGSRGGLGPSCDSDEAAAPALQGGGKQRQDPGRWGRQAALSVCAEWTEWMRGWRETTRHWVRACLKPEGVLARAAESSGKARLRLMTGVSVPQGDVPHSAPRRTGRAGVRRGHPSSAFRHGRPPVSPGAPRGLARTRRCAGAALALSRQRRTAASWKTREWKT